MCFEETHSHICCTIFTHAIVFVESCQIQSSPGRRAMESDNFSFKRQSKFLAMVQTVSAPLEVQLARINARRRSVRTKTPDDKTPPLLRTTTVWTVRSVVVLVSSILSPCTKGNCFIREHFIVISSGFQSRCDLFAHTS